MERKPSTKTATLNPDDGWREYIRGGRKDISLRNKLIEAEIPMIKRYAWSMSRRVNNRLSVEELIGAATIGAIEAAKSYDPNRGYKFWTFASRRVVGAMLDWLREYDQAGRISRGLINRYEELANSRIVAGLEPLSLEEAAKALGVKMARLRQAMLSSQVLFCDIDANLSKRGGKEVRAANNLDALVCEDWDPLSDADSLKDICRMLDGDEFTIVHLYYVRRATMKRIGDALGISESRVSQMHSDLVKKIRQSIEGRHAV